MAILFLSLTLILSHVAPSHGAAFAVELINRDSPMSPLYDATATSFDRWRVAAERSHERARHFASRRVSSSAFSRHSLLNPLGAISGAYLTALSIGTPPVLVAAIADTGSDLTWMECVPCTNCCKKKAPLFDPANSSSYYNLPCSSSFCNALPKHSCDGSRCNYQYSYVDGSIVSGVLATETFTFASDMSGGNASVEATVFGCTHQSHGTVGVIGILIK